MIEEEIRQILLDLGEDPEREGLVKTPERVRKSLQFLTRGYKQDINAVINGAIFNEDCDDMIIVRDIEFYSMCEHHMLPFSANATSAMFRTAKYSASASWRAWWTCSPDAFRFRSA